MQEINGTITLAFVEEDNKQRVIFRVIPLCTREGNVYQQTEEIFPDEGSLRIVPDKREQSTFKDRMHEINGLCAINLVNHDGKELIKVRQNRNYSPEAGECNRFAIYSDVICDFAPDGVFEVLEPGQDASNVLTRNVIFSKDKVLYGPVAREEAAAADVAALKPFGNDQFLLHVVEVPGRGKRTIYWNPEAIVNLRQRRNALRRNKERNAAEAAAAEAKAEEKAEVKAEVKAEQKPEPKAEPKPQAKPEPKAEPKAEAKPAAEKPAAEKKPEPKAKEKPAPAPAPAKPAAEDNAALPIGTRLNILDEKLTFDQQISRLEQELGSEANRLSLEEAPQEDDSQIVAHFKGTPLVRGGKPITKTTVRPESVHHVVDKQLTKENSSYQAVENPIDQLRTKVDYIWQNADMRSQAVSMFAENETFMADMLQLFRKNGVSTQATAAAVEQFSEIEAERLSLLMQLDMAKNNEKKYREEALASLSRRLKADSDHLKAEVEALQKSKAALLEQMEALSQENADKTRKYVANHLKCLSAAGQNRLALTPVIGRRYEPAQMVEMLRVHMNEGGYGMNEDEAMSLLVHLAVSDVICFSAATEADAARFARIALESLGLQSVSAFMEGDCSVELISLLPEDGNRTPTVSVQPFGTQRISGFGHRTVYLVEEKTLRQLPADQFPDYPILSIHTSAKRNFARNADFEAIPPVALSSLMDLRADSQPMLTEAEKWFAQLDSLTSSGSYGLSQASRNEMRRFIEVASHKVRGGFLAAEDAALCHWFVPAAQNGFFPDDELKAVVQGLPKAMMVLRID